MDGPSGQLSINSRANDDSSNILKDTLTCIGVPPILSWVPASSRLNRAAKAAVDGASIKQIAKTNGHMSVEVLLRCERGASLFKRNAVASTRLLPPNPRGCLRSGGLLDPLVQALSPEGAVRSVGEAYRKDSQ